MANHNQLRRVSVDPQANTIPYASEDGFITAWLDNDPLINSLKQQNQLIGSVATAPEPDTQSILTQFVVDTAGRQPRNGDEVSILDVGELWRFNGTDWVFFTDTVISDASTTEKGVMQVGTGLSVSNGLVSVDSSIYWAARTSISSAEVTPTLAAQQNTDYTFSNPLTSLTLSSVPNSSYYTTISFTTASTFAFSAPTLTKYYFESNPPTFLPNKEYELVIVNGKCHVNYIGARTYPISKITATNPVLTPVNNIATWSITNTLADKNVFIRVIDSTSGETVEVESISTVSAITIKLYTESVSVAAGTYTAIILG